MVDMAASDTFMRSMKPVFGDGGEVVGGWNTSEGGVWRWVWGRGGNPLMRSFSYRIIGLGLLIQIFGPRV
jgi:hypothetical protein